MTWPDEVLAYVERQLRAANGKRTTRVMTLAQVEACFEAALDAREGYAWARAGTPGDARAVTTVCLVARGDTHLTLGIGAAHGDCTPAQVWSDLDEWDRFEPLANQARVQTWSRRKRDDRVRLAWAPPRTEKSGHDELLDAVLAKPTDDGPRQVYADALLEAGDARGEFITAQLASPPARSVELSLRVERLLHEHGAKWLAAFGDFRATGRTTMFAGPGLLVEFSRGFVSDVVVTEPSAVVTAERLMAVNPVRSLTLETDQRFQLAPLLASPRLPHLEHFAILRTHPRPDLRESLADELTAGHWRALTHLRLVGACVGDAGLERFNELAARWPKLTSLGIELDALTARGLLAWKGQKWVGRLERLSFRDDGLGPAGVHALLRLGLHRLVALDLSGNGIANEGVDALTASPRLRSLEHLRLARNRITSEGAYALLNADTLRGVTDLDLNGNPLSAMARSKVRARFPQA